MSMPVFRKPTNATMDEALVSLLISTASGIDSGAYLLSKEACKTALAKKLACDDIGSDTAKTLIDSLAKSVEDALSIIATREESLSSMATAAGKALRL